MFRSNSPASLAGALILLVWTLAASHLADAASPNATAVNRGVIELETGSADSISVRLAAEIASIVNDGATRRVVPVIGRGPLQNLMDLKYLRGIDLAIIQEDALNYARSQNFLSGLDSLSYISKLHNEEFHLLAQADIKTPNDLNGKTVNADVTDSSTAFTAARLFQLLQINVKLATDTQQVALEKLRKGEIAAVAFVTAKPSTIFHALTPGDHLHFLSIPLAPSVMSVYAPAALTSSDYPNLIAADQAVDTIAVSNVLMAADLRMLPERDSNIRNFTETFYTGFQALLGPGYDPKWRDVNIVADLPGWTRHPGAVAWLRNNPQIAALPTSDALKELFSRFIDEHRQASGGGAMSVSDKNALFQEFEDWQRGHSR